MVAVIMRAGLLAAAATAVTLLGGGVAGAATPPGCAGAASGGDWPSYSGQLPAAGAPGGNRLQPSEQAITPSNVSQLGLAWKLDMPDGGVIDHVPTESDGCVFVGTDLGTVYAVNADTGAVVWQNKLAKTNGNSVAVGAGVIGSPAISNGIVYVGVTTATSSTEMALDETTGSTVWSTPIDTDPGGGADSSPVVFDTGGGPMVLQAYQGDESSNHSNPGYAILNATTGAIIYAGKILPTAAYAAGDRGGSIVDTPAIDEDAKVAYAGTGNPASVHQNQITDSEIKIDLNPVSPTFGQIIGAARGTSDSYPSPSDANLPTCPQTRYQQWPVGPASCLSLDYNFLSTGDLYTAGNGQQMFAELQKSGVMQAVNTKDMSVAWKSTLSVPCLACNGGSTAADANGIYAATTGGNLYGLNKDTGAVKWAVGGTGVDHYQGVTVANGVVYDTNEEGAIEAFDASNGVPLWVHNVLTESGGPYSDGGNSDGISVARDTVYAASAKANGAGSALFAFKVGAGSGGGLPPLPSPPPPPSVPTPAQTILTAPGATNTTFATPVIVLPQGSPLNYTNLDTVAHNVTSSQGLFSSPTESLGGSAPVSGVQNLAPGTYSFYCSLHPWMTGQIIVEANTAAAGANHKSSRKG
jgi:outer membrane protein assembly factor BamB